LYGAGGFGRRPGFAVRKEKAGFYADAAGIRRDARGFRLHRYWFTFDAVTVQARHLRASLLIGVDLR
jgi:hypothetical protein